jgi:lipopolysaccharide biosynthesis protein
MRLGSRRAHRVRSLVGGNVKIERGSLADPLGPRAAVVAQWSTTPTMTRSVCTLVHELQAFGYRVVVSSSCEASAALEWDDSVAADDLIVIRKPNIGYDFGSWTIALELLPALCAADWTILTNDSMVGPFTSLRPLLEQLDTTTADVWGMTDTQQFERHLQSYFLGFRNGVLADRPLRDFWADIREESNKDQIIDRYEIGLGRLLHAEGYVQAPAFPHELAVEPGQNPVIIGWRQLLECGFPFLKREILRTPSVAPAGTTAPAVLKQLLDVDVADWVEGVAA